MLKQEQVCEGHKKWGWRRWLRSNGWEVKTRSMRVVKIILERLKGCEQESVDQWLSTMFIQMLDFCQLKTTSQQCDKCHSSHRFVDYGSDSVMTSSLSSTIEQFSTIVNALSQLASPL